MHQRLLVLVGLTSLASCSGDRLGDDGGKNGGGQGGTIGTTSTGSPGSGTTTGSPGSGGAPFGVGGVSNYGDSGGGPSEPTGIGGAASLCTSYCALAKDCVEDCMATCESYMDPPCEKQGTEVVDCLVEYFDPTTCTSPLPAQQQVDCSYVNSNLADCRAKQKQMCQPETCGGTDDHCSCSADCQGGKQQALCQINGSYAECSCYLNGTLLGICSPKVETGTNLCDMQGCCSYVFGSGS